MKQIISLLFILISSVSYSQSITLEEVLELKNKNHREVKKYLQDRNWKIMHEHFSKELKFGDIRFSFDDANPDREIPLYITFYHEANEITKNRVEFQVTSKEKFDSYVSQLKSSNFNVISSTTDANQTVDTFKDEFTTIEMKTIPVENYHGKQVTFYKFYLLDTNYKKVINKF